MLVTALMFATLTSPARPVSATPRPRVSKTIQVGDCVASAGALREYREPLEDWEEREPLEYSFILAKGKRAFKTKHFYNGSRGQSDYISKIEYKYIYNYTKIECPK